MIDIINVAIYSVLGIILMMVGNFLIDMIIPCHFPTEIKNGNVAVGYLSAGSFIGTGIVLKAAIASRSATIIEETLFTGIASSILYFILGIAFCIIGYLVLDFVNKKYDLNKEIGKGNPAAGIMVSGMFIGLAIVISGVIY
jgi:putative membrane protein